MRSGNSGSDEEAFDARRLVWMLVRWRYQILLVALLVVVPVAIATLSSERLYRAATLIEVSAEPRQVLPYPDFPAGGGSGQYYMTTQEQVLRGASLHGRVARRLQADTRPEIAGEAAHVSARVGIEQVPTSQLFRITYMAGQPETAAEVANLFADEFIQQHYDNQQAIRRKAQEVLERELAVVEARVQQSERQLVAYAQSHEIHRADQGGGDLDQEKLSIVARQLIEAENEVAVARTRWLAMQEATVGAFPERLMTPVIAGRRSTLLQIEHEVTALRATFGENWPAVVQKRNELATVRAQADREMAEALAQARDQALLDFRAAEGKRRALAEVRADQQARVLELQNASIQYNIIRREVATNQKLYDGLLERLRQTGVSAGTDFGNVHVVERAVPNVSVASPDVGWNLLVASVLGLSLGLLVALAGEFWRNTLSTIEDVEHVTTLSVLSSIPLVRVPRVKRELPGVTRRITGLLGVAPEDAGTDLPVVAESARHVDLATDASAAESIRTLCASILLSRSERPPRVLAITSATAGEGKTTIAIQLGRALADTGVRTVVVECDLRRPAFLEELGVGSEGGLSLYLSGHLSKPVVHTTTTDGLHAIAAGPVPPNPVALLNSDRLTNLLTDLSNEYGFVILDTPPAVPMADARVVGARADGVLLVVRAGRASRSLLRRVQSVLENAGAPLLGAVLNGTDAYGADGGSYDSYKAYARS